MKIKLFGAAIALAATVVQPVAATAQQACVSREDLRKGLSYVAPLLIDGMVQTCTPFVTAESPILELGPKMAENYLAVANPTDSEILALVQKFGGAFGPIPQDASMEAIKAEFVAEMAKDIKAEHCAIAEKFVTDLAALPAANILGLLETGIYMAELNDRQKKAKKTKKPIQPSAFCDG